MSVARIVGADDVIARLEALPNQIEAGLAAAVAKLAFRLQDRVRAKINGDALKGGSGALAASVEATVGREGAKLTASVGVSAPMAGFLEYGFQGSETVSAHLREIKEAFGRPIKGGAKGILVRAYQRQVDFPAHSFLRTALEEMDGEIADELSGAVADAVKS